MKRLLVLLWAILGCGLDVAAQRPDAYSVQLFHNRRKVYDGSVPDAQWNLRTLEASDDLRLILDGPEVGTNWTFVWRGVHGDTIRVFRFPKVDPEEGVILPGKELVRWRKRLLGKTMLWYAPPKGEPFRVAQLVVEAVE